MADTSTRNDEARNYFRLVKLTMTEGTRSIRKVVLSQLPGGQTLQMALNQKEEKFRSLNANHRSLLNGQQLAILYPPNGNCDLSAIDMTLWCFLARNLLPRSNKTLINWGDDDHPPLPGQEEWYHDIVRIRLTRNKLFHIQRPELDGDTFKDLWNYVTGALRRLDGKLDFNDFLTAEYDRAAAREFEIQVKEQVMQEMNGVLRVELGFRRRFQRVLLVVSLLMLIALIGTIVAILVTCQKEKSCEKGVVYRRIGDSGAIYLVPRSAWGALPPNGKYVQLHIPVSTAVYSHTAEIAQCFVTQDCCNQVKAIQLLHLHSADETGRSFVDIEYHFLIDGNGYIYEGRPINAAADFRYERNHTHVSIALIGNFMYKEPAVAAIAGLDLLLEYLMDSVNALHSNFTLLAACDLYRTKSPGRKLYEKLQVSSEGIDQYPNIKQHLPVKTWNNSHCNFAF